jgi:hypothetical protein
VDAYIRRRQTLLPVETIEPIILTHTDKDKGAENEAGKRSTRNRRGMEHLTDTLAGLEAGNVSNSGASPGVASTTAPQRARAPIPGPPGMPILGNLADLDREVPQTTFVRLAETYGPIFSLQLGGGPKRVFVSSVALLEEMCDEKRFGKIVSGTLAELRAGIGSGLFTAHSHEREWAIAHRILMPEFGPLAIRQMFDGS